MKTAIETVLELTAANEAAANSISEPDQEQILAECRLTGLTFDSARAALKERLLAKSRQLAAAMPGALETLARAKAEAEAAKAEADAVFSRQASVLEQVQKSLLALGADAARLSDVQNLALSPADEKSLAEAVIHRLVEFKTSPSTHTETAYQSTLAMFTERKALSPHIPGALKSMQAAIDKKTSDIKKLAASNGVDLPAVLKLMENHPERERFLTYSSSRVYEAFFQ